MSGDSAAEPPVSSRSSENEPIASGSSSGDGLSRRAIPMHTKNRPFSHSACVRSALRTLSRAQSQATVGRCESRSIARLIRQSLGSIRSAQAYFAKKQADSADKRHPLGQQLPAMHQLTLEEDEEPVASPRAVAPEDTLGKEDREALSWRDLRIKVIAELEACTSRWSLLDHAPAHSNRSVSTASTISEPPQETHPDDASLIPDLLDVTSRSVRTVQSFVTALPPDIIPVKQRRSSSHEAPPSDSPLSARHASQATLSTAARPKTLRPSLTTTFDLPPPVEDDPLTQLRKASLDVLGSLNEMSARFRVNATDASEADVHEYGPAALEDVAEQAKLVRTWLQAVDRVLRAVARHTRAQKASADDGEDSDPVSTDMDRTPSGSLPVWARADDDLPPLARVHALLVAHLPVQLIGALPFSYEPDNRAQLLEALADGQLLVVAYNAVLRASASPWGLIPSHSIHDVRTLVAQGGQTVGMTFRRLENLKVWLAAVRLRYSVSLSTIDFDIKTVARRSPEDRERWLAMLETAVCRWTAAVVAETRSAAGAAINA